MCWLPGSTLRSQASIGLIASIGTIASAGFAVAKAISDLADELGTAGQNIKLISVDTKAVALILHEMKRRLDKSTRIAQQTIDVALEIVDLCKSDLESIKQFLIPVLSTGGDKMSMVQRARWIFVKAKISTKRVSLNSLKLTINLFIHTLDFIEGDLLDEEHTKDKIENMVVESKNTKSAFLAAERTDQTFERACVAALPSSPDTHNDSTGPIVQLLHHGGQSQVDGKLVLKRVDDQKGDMDIVANLLQTDQYPQLDDNRQSDFQTVESLSDDDFLQIAWHVRTQRSVASYALVVLDKGYETKDVTSTEHHSETEAQSNTSRNFSANERQGANVPSSQDIPDDDGPSKTGHVDEQSSERSESEGNSSRAHTPPTGHSATRRDRGKYFHKEPRGRSSGHHQHSRVKTDAQGASKFPDDFGRPSPRFRGDDYFNIPPRHWDKTPSMPYNDFMSGFGRSPDYGNVGRSFGDSYMQSYPFPPPPPPPRPATPPSSATGSSSIFRENPETVAMKRQLAEIKREQERREAEARQIDLERRVRNEAEEEFTRKMEQMRREEEVRAEERKLALEKAKKEIEMAREDAERNTRQAIEAEIKDAERKEMASKLKRLELEAFDRVQATMKAEAGSRKGLRRILPKF